MSPKTRMPTLFVGHGSPMNALGGNAYAAALTRLGAALPRPVAILVVSAHWRTRGVQVLDVASPRTIHDFGGFPAPLYAMTYPAPGAPALATRVQDLLGDFDATPTAEWGLDHGAWAVLKHLYPAADIPVTQLGLDKRADPSRHLDIAKALAPLRDEGVLILGSGNLTHNLGEVDWSERPQPMAWAVDFDRRITDAIVQRDVAVLAARSGIPPEMWRRAHPTTEHYIPLLYAFGAAGADDAVTFPYTEIQAGSLSMRSVQFG